MKPLNYVRDAVRGIRQMKLPWFKKNHPAEAVAIEKVLDIAVKAEKFILPNFGRIFADGKRTVPYPLNLPFKTIAIEYPSTGANIDRGNGPKSPEKQVIIACQGEDTLYIYTMDYIILPDGSSSWDLEPTVGVIPIHKPDDGDDEHYSFELHHLSSSSFIEDINKRDEFKDKEIKAYDEFRILTSNRLLVLFEFLTALSCSNVNYESKITSAGSARAAMKQKKGALPFDSYRILTLKVLKKQTTGDTDEPQYDRHSPREHVRRGHVRRYKSGIRVWINAMIINAGVGGKLSKTYNVKP